jgi:hypothetical protein
VHCLDRRHRALPYCRAQFNISVMLDRKRLGLLRIRLNPSRISANSVLSPASAAGDSASLLTRRTSNETATSNFSDHPNSTHPLITDP